MAWSRWVTEVSCFWKPSFWMPWKPEKIHGENSQVPYFWGTHSRERRNWWCRWFNFLEEPPCSQMQQRTTSTHYWPLNLPSCNLGHCWAGLWLHFSSKVFIQKSLEHFSWMRCRQKQHPHSRVTYTAYNACCTSPSSCWFQYLEIWGMFLLGMWGNKGVQPTDIINKSKKIWTSNWTTLLTVTTRYKTD